MRGRGTLEAAEAVGGPGADRHARCLPLARLLRVDEVTAVSIPTEGAGGRLAPPVPLPNEQFIDRKQTNTIANMAHTAIARELTRATEMLRSTVIPQLSEAGRPPGAVNGSGYDTSPPPEPTRFSRPTGRSAREGEPRFSRFERHPRSVEANDAERCAVVLDVE